MKPVFRTYLSMALLGIGSLCTGVLIHYSYHFENHDIWHLWSVAHVIINILFLICVGIHIKQHKGWFKQLLSISSLKKKIAIFVTVAFFSTSISGIYLLADIEGQGSHAGLVHYWLGMIFGGLAIVHLVKRWKIFSSGISS